MTTKQSLVGSGSVQMALVDEKEGLAHLFDGNTTGVIWRRRLE